jgi:hypothetical protein
MTNKHSFESFIAQCCKAPEWELRAFIRKVLSRAGFSIIEDDYRGRRGGKFDLVHNMLAVRGTPDVCLVAHTDVCRDHIVDGDDIPVVNPEIKFAQVDGEIREIIQDEGPNYQVGGDDRLGVAINLYIALNSGMDLALLFTTDEEVGLLSADKVRFAELLDFELLVQVDRGNHSNQLVNRIGGTQLCSLAVEQRLLRIAEEIGLPRNTVNGMLTDVLSIKNNRMCHNAVNMTCGYHNSFGSSKNEFIDVQEARDTMRYVASIVKDFYLNGRTEEFFDASSHESSQEKSGEENSIEFTEEELMLLAEMEAEAAIKSSRANNSRRGRRYYDDEGGYSSLSSEEDLFSEEAYALDHMEEDSDTDWDSWRQQRQEKSSFA